MANRWLPFLFPAPVKTSPKPPARPPATFTVVAGGREIVVTLRRNARAKRYTLRLTPKLDGAVVTIPRRGTIAEAKAFVARHANWMDERIATRTPEVLAPGAAVFVRGVPHIVTPTGTLRGVVRAVRGEAGQALLMVPGDAEQAARKVTDFLKKLARGDYADAVERHARALGVTPGAIRLKDTSTRWGSASTSGTLSFSWRLIMAPAFVLDYLAAHEVAHLKEMNHSDRFWAICYRLAPRTDEAKAWLKAHGRDLHRMI